MNKNAILEYSPIFEECSLKMITNERLLNSFMTLLFAKTCLYQSYCVMKCLDLIKGYFEVITKKKKKLPNDFNFNYFYTGLKTILDSNHSYLLVKVISLSNIGSFSSLRLLSSFFKGVQNNSQQLHSRKAILQPLPPLVRLCSQNILLPSPV